MTHLSRESWSSTSAAEAPQEVFVNSLLGAQGGVNMNLGRSFHVGGLALVFIVSSGMVVSSKPPSLSKSARAAIAAYLTELRASPDGEGIVDPEAADLADKLKHPARKYYEQPQFPEDLRRAKRHDHARCVVAGVIEPDGTVSHPKAVVPAIDPRFDDVALAAVKNARYDGPILTLW